MLLYMKDTTGTRLGRFDNLYRSLARDPVRGDDGRRTSDVEVPSSWDRPSKWLSRQITVAWNLRCGFTARILCLEEVCGSLYFSNCKSRHTWRLCGGSPPSSGGWMKRWNIKCFIEKLRSKSLRLRFPSVPGQVLWASRTRSRIRGGRSNVDACSPARKKDYRRMCLWKLGDGSHCILLQGLFRSSGRMICYLPVDKALTVGRPR